MPSADNKVPGVPKKLETVWYDIAYDLRYWNCEIVNYENAYDFTYDFTLYEIKQCPVIFGTPSIKSVLSSFEIYF
jgi:hypothetical protein